MAQVEGKELFELAQGASILIQLATFLARAKHYKQQAGAGVLVKLSLLDGSNGGQGTVVAVNSDILQEALAARMLELRNQLEAKGVDLAMLLDELEANLEKEFAPPQQRTL
jgi:hypothetical protein